MVCAGYSADAGWQTSGLVPPRARPAIDDVFIHMMSTMSSMATAFTEMVRSGSRSPTWMSQQHVDVAGQVAADQLSPAWSVSSIHPQPGEPALDTTTTAETTTTTVSDTIGSVLQYLNL